MYSILDGGYGGVLIPASEFVGARIAPVVRSMLRRFSLLTVQTDEYAERLRALGIEPRGAEPPLSAGEYERSDGSTAPLPVSMASLAHTPLLGTRSRRRLARFWAGLRDAKRKSKTA